MGKRIKSKIQCEVILEHMKTHVGITQREADDLYGVARLASRIFDLREQGHNIASIQTKIINRYGEPRKCVQYRLIKEKQEE